MSADTLAFSFYEPLGVDAGDEVVRSTEHTAGPWDAGAQHGGPPSALLGRALERVSRRDDTRLARVTVEILGPVPVGELRVRARVARAGRRVELVEASLHDVAAGREVARAQGWRISAAPGRVRDVEHPDVAPDRPADEQVFGFPGAPEGFGYGRAVEWRFVSGDPGAMGPAEVWTRLRGAVVAGEQPSGWQRVLAVADSGNGISAELPLDRWLFINPDLTVHLTRPPAGAWVCLQGRTTVAGDGVGLAQTAISDDGGRIGSGLQSLLVAPR